MEGNKNIFKTKRGQEKHKYVHRTSMKMEKMSLNQKKMVTCSVSFVTQPPPIPSG